MSARLDDTMEVLTPKPTRLDDDGLAFWLWLIRCEAQLEAQRKEGV